MNSYNIISREEASTLMREYKGEFFEEFDYNKANSYILSNGNLIIFPALGDSAMLFLNKKNYKAFLNNRAWPKPSNDPFYDFKNEFQSVESNISFFQNLLSRELNANISLKQDKDVIDLFDQLNSCTIDEKRFYNRIFIPMGIVIGNYIREKHQLNWHLTPMYQFDVYYVPVLKTEEGFEFLLWRSVEDSYENTYFNVENFLFSVDIFTKVVEDQRALQSILPRRLSSRLPKKAP